MAMSRAEIERRRQEAAHARATGRSTTVSRRCLVPGCVDEGQWSECADARAARIEQEAHYAAHHLARPSAELVAALSGRRGIN